MYSINYSHCLMCFVVANWYNDSSGEPLLCYDDTRFVAFASELVASIQIKYCHQRLCMYVCIYVCLFIRLSAGVS